jgi:hypothetical protein
MSATTWNFPTWQCQDRGIVLTRATAGGAIDAAGPLPFSSSIMGVFSFLIRSDYTADGNEAQMLTSIGASGATQNAMAIEVYHSAAASSYIWFRFWDEVGGVYRYREAIGDENGTDWLQTDKWYQVAFTADASALTVVVNNSTTPTQTISTNVPGALNLAEGTERWRHAMPSANSGIPPGSKLTEWPSVLLGPSAWEATTQDLSTAAVRDRIFDADGNYKPAGANGSLWFNDAYTTTAGYSPDQYFNEGYPRFETGSHSLSWTAGTGVTFPDAPGGNRKMYE